MSSQPQNPLQQNHAPATGLMDLPREIRVQILECLHRYGQRDQIRECYRLGRTSLRHYLRPSYMLPLCRRSSIIRQEVYTNFLYRSIDLGMFSDFSQWKMGVLADTLQRPEIAQHLRVLKTGAGPGLRDTHRFQWCAQLSQILSASQQHLLEITSESRAADSALSCYTNFANLRKLKILRPYKLMTRGAVDMNLAPNLAEFFDIMYSPQLREFHAEYLTWRIIYRLARTRQWTLGVSTLEVISLENCLLARLDLNRLVSLPTHLRTLSYSSRDNRNLAPALTIVEGDLENLHLLRPLRFSQGHQVCRCSTLRTLRVDSGYIMEDKTREGAEDFCQLSLCPTLTELTVVFDHHPGDHPQRYQDRCDVDFLVYVADYIAEQKARYIPELTALRTFVMEFKRPLNRLPREELAISGMPVEESTLLEQGYNAAGMTVVWRLDGEDVEAARLDMGGNGRWHIIPARLRQFRLR